MAAPDCGIFGASPVETLNITHVVIDNIPRRKKAGLDRLELRFHKTHTESFCSTFPSTTCCNGKTNIYKISVADCLGLVISFVTLGHYDEGLTSLLALDNCHKKKEATVTEQEGHWYEPFFKDILQVFEAMLCFDKWFRKDSYWVDHNAEVNKAIVSHSFAKIMNLSKKYIPTSKGTPWNYPKSHELLHIANDMSCFSAPPQISVLNAQNHCSLLQLSNQAGVLKNATKKWSMNSRLRIFYSLMINSVHDCIQNGNLAPPAKKQVDTFLNQCHIHKSTKGSMTSIHTREAAGANNIMPI